ncbi:hypothetical protein N7513_002589 [Penicillium frequentans]|nr:hypothetical protein N7513_002589 [Penicillium glabrum]
MSDQPLDISCAGQCANPKHGTEHRVSFAPKHASSGENFDDIRNFILSIGELYHQGHWNTAELEAGLHDAWDMLVQTSKITPATSPEQDKLVVLVLTIGALRIFSHTNESSEGKSQDISFSHGDPSRNNNLPLFARDLQNEWITKSQQSTSCERESLAVFTAKLYAAGLFEIELNFVALWLLKKTLEEDLPLRNDANEDDGITQCDGLISKPAVAELLPACFAWSANANFKLLTAAAESYNPCQSASMTSDYEAQTKPGSLAVKANIRSSGFSISRWVFWRFRVKELTSCADEEISQLARRIFDDMIHTGVVLGIEVHGEKNYLNKVHEAVSTEFKARGMTQCVDASDVSINLDWAD